MSKPLVSISCITYNHEKYIKQCLDGFLMQKTNFDFEILIHDDASTDKTADIIREYEKKYPDKFRCIYQTENQYSKGVRGIMARFNFPRAQGKYIALCEGDDYWTDPYKLQKQVDFLENNKEYVLCGTDVKRINVKTGKEMIIKEKYFGEVTQTDILQRNRFSTCTVMIKNMDVSKILFPNFNKFKVGDWPLWNSLLRYGKGMNLPDVTAQYNIHDKGMVSGRNISDTLFSKLNDRIQLIENFPDKKKLIKSHGNRILLHYIKQIFLMNFSYLKALFNNRKIIVEFIRK